MRIEVLGFKGHSWERTLTSSLPPALNRERKEKRMNHTLSSNLLQLQPPRAPLNFEGLCARPAVKLRGNHEEHWKAGHPDLTMLGIATEVGISGV